MAVIGGEQVLPLGVPIGVGVGAAAVGGGEDVAPIVVGVRLKPGAGGTCPRWGLKKIMRRWGRSQTRDSRDMTES